MLRRLAVLTIALSICAKQNLPAGDIGPASTNCVVTDPLFREVSGACQIAGYSILAGDEKKYPLLIVKGQSVFKVDVEKTGINDIEALAMVDEKSFIAMGSQSRNKDGEAKGDRSSIGLFTFPDGFEAKGDVRVREGLRDALVSAIEAKSIFDADALAAMKNNKTDEGGLNCEGAAYVGETEFYIGLREPVSKLGHPVIVRVANIKNFISNGAPLAVDGVFEVESIIDKGIRDMAVRDGKLFLLLGGVEDSFQPRASLALWDPKEPAKAKESSIRPADKKGLRPFAAEALWANDAGKFVIGFDVAGGSSLKDVTQEFPMPAF